jgi:hypothetical protein
MILISLSSLALAIGFYSVGQLVNQGKLKWSKEGRLLRGFWDDDSYLRKYKLTPESTVMKAPENWYYRFFKIKYKERFPLSATFLVNLTDGYHLMQSLSFLSLSVCVSLLSGITFWYVWLGVLAVHFLTYKLLSK